MNMQRSKVVAARFSALKIERRQPGAPASLPKTGRMYDVI